MATFYTFALVLILGLCFGGLTLGLPYFFCRDKIGLLSFSGIPLGTLLPWFVALLGIGAIAPHVPEVNQAGFGFVPVLVFLGMGFCFFLSSIVGAIWFLDILEFWPRFWLGAKYATIPAVIVYAFIVYISVN